MTLIEGVKLSKMCDYSFGDQSSIVCNVWNGYMTSANETNSEFISVVDKLSNKRIITLYIDNIRLYKRPVVAKNPIDQNWIDSLMDQNDLLNLCSKHKNSNFIIFTGNEDTEIDSQIIGKIPENVLKIYAVNAVYHDDKVKAFPYGIQRKLSNIDNRHELILQAMEYSTPPNKLLYVNHSIHTNVLARSGIHELFINKSWATVDYGGIPYRDFLEKIKNHKFMICPVGNAIDCHRNWEVLYLRRVPVMVKHQYLEHLFSNFPVLFVDSFSDITDQLLIDNEYLFNEALQISPKVLDMDYIYNKIIHDYS